MAPGTFIVIADTVKALLWQGQVRLGQHCPSQGPTLGPLSNIVQTLRRTRAPRWVTNVCIQVAGVVQVRVNWFETMLRYGQLILAGLLYLGHCWCSVD